MDWTNMLTDIMELCIIPLLGVLTAYLITFIQAKKAELAAKANNETAAKYIGMLADTISSCVIATKQTYVEALKKQNAFTAEAQQEAFSKTFDAVMAVLTEDAKNYLTLVYGDLTAYITQKIEAEVNLTK